MVDEFNRLKGDDVYFLTGTDEHGLKNMRAAEANEMTPKEWVTRTSQRYIEAWEQLGITYDRFIRTTDDDHHVAVAKILEACRANGDIELRSYEGLYSVADEEYVTPEEVPELERLGRPVVEMKEENYFFLLSKYEDRLLEWYENNPDVVQPVTSAHAARSMQEVSAPE